MEDFLQILKSFNRKERFYLIGKALGNKDFILSEDFRNIIGNKLNLEIPKDAFAAMDYHLDWIYASLYCTTQGATNLISDNTFRLNANQDDIDFLIAFRQDDIYHLIMIEAKAESGWTNKQFGSKAKKLETIFGFNSCLWKNVKPYFLITSPRKPINLRVEALPAYLQRTMENIWFRLDIPKYLVKITRCDELGKASIVGSKWRVEKT